MATCSSLWNGAGALIVPVTKAGRIWPGWEMYFEVRPVDRVFLHQSLDGAARDAAVATFPGAVQMWPGFSDHDLHPLLLESRTERGEVGPPLSVPSFATQGLRRVALACWGTIPGEDLPHWRERFDVWYPEGQANHGALITGQTGIGSSSPLLLAQRGMGVVSWINPQDWPYLWIFDRGSFNELVNFWNFRARSLAGVSGGSVIGVPLGALRDPQALLSLREWVTAPPGQERVPELLVCTSEALAHDVESALDAAGFEHDAGSKLTHRSGEVSAPERPRWRSVRPMLGHRLVRGAVAHALIAVGGGKSSMSLPAPAAFTARTGHTIRLELLNPPLPLPLTETIAQALGQGFSASDGALLHTWAYTPWNLDIELPDASAALQGWATDKGFAVEPSRDGRDGQALLMRLGDLDGLDVLADGLVLEVLALLAPESRHKLVQRLGKLVSAPDSSAAVEQLSERLRDLGLFLEVRARSAEALASRLKRNRGEVLAALSALVAAGFVQRGAAFRCVRCHYNDFIELADLRERVRCRACRADQLLPVTDQSGEREPALAYRLDGLIARAMDQDLIPVLLALRALRAPKGQLFYAWPGLLMSDGDGEVDVDLLVSDGSIVTACECKRTATALGDEQLQRLLKLTDALGVRPAIAALHGSFATSHRQEIETRGGQVLLGAQLLAP